MKMTEDDVTSTAGCVEFRRGPPDGVADVAFLGTSLVDSNSFLCIQSKKQLKNSATKFISSANTILQQRITNHY